MTGYKGQFDILWWKWYIVDLSDWYKPLIVRKHFNTKKQARGFKKKNFNRHFEIVSGREVKTYKVFQWTKPRKCGYKEANYPKYDYPEDCKTKYQKKLFRNSQRRKMRTDKNKDKPKLKEIHIWDLLDNKPMLFLTRLKKQRNNHYICSQGNRQLREFIGKKYPNEIIPLHIIVKTLIYYNYGRAMWKYKDVAKLIYLMWQERIDKRLKNPSIPNNQELFKEFLARGFIPLSETDFDPEEDNYIATNIHIKPELVYPVRCYHTASEKGIYDHYIYDLLPLVGIPGYTRAHVAGLIKRR